MSWYPAAPAAGPFAAPASPQRGTARFHRFPKPAPGRLPARRGGRGRLANVLLFGFGPLALAGIVVAAFVLISPGSGSAAARFQAGPAATAPQAASVTQSVTGSPSPSHPAKAEGKGKGKAKPAQRHSSPSPSASAKKPGAAKTATPKKPKPKPTHRAGGGRVVPHNLGAPDFAGYCHHIGARTAEVTASNAYGWHCTLNPSRVLQVISVCAWTHHLDASQVVSVSTNFDDPNAWQCWRINKDLGTLDFSSYCAAAGLGTGKLIAQNAYGWRCTGSSAPIDTTAACDAVYHVGDAISRFTVFADPYSWQCWD